MGLGSALHLEGDEREETEMAKAADLQSMMAMVTAILAKADATEEQYPAEAATYRAKAEQIMRKFRIEANDLLAADAMAMEPVWVDFDLLTTHNEFTNHYLKLVRDAAQHAQVKYAQHRNVFTGVVRIFACGFEPEIRVFEWILNAARLAFKERLEPDVKPDLSDEENIWRLRQAGVTRARVATLLWGSDPKDGAAHGKVGRIYKEQCQARGETPALDGRGLSLDAYRSAYSDHFVRRFGERLADARDGLLSDGGALVLGSHDKKISDTFYARFPDIHPDRIKERHEALKKEMEVLKAQTPAKKERQPRVRQWTQADEARWQRNNNSAAARAGRMAGESAADEVEIDRTKRTGRIQA